AAENGIGAAIRRWLPSTGRGPQRPTQLSKAGGGNFRDIDSRSWAQRLSNTGGDLTYAQSYPQVWIARALQPIRTSAPRHARIETNTSHGDQSLSGLADSSTRAKQVARGIAC